MGAVRGRRNHLAGRISVFANGVFDEAIKLKSRRKFGVHVNVIPSPADDVLAEQGD